MSAEASNFLYNMGYDELAALVSTDFRISHKERIERLQNLKRVVKSIPDKAFDLRSVFVIPCAKDPDEVLAKIGHVPLGHCGAVGCAFGWAGLDPWFQKRGAKTDVLNDHTLFRIGQKHVSETEWFGLTEEDTNMLFFPGNGQKSISKKSTLRRIDLLIQKYEYAEKMKAVFEGAAQKVKEFRQKTEKLDEKILTA